MGIITAYRIFGKKILLDTGGSDLFIKNLKKLGMDVADVDYAVLSHAHCDHANGMPAFFRNNSKAKFYLRDGTSDNCYGKIGFLHFFAGIPREMISEYHDRIVMASEDYTIMDGVYLIPASAGSLTNTAFQYLIVKAPFGVCLFLSVMTAFLHMALTSPGLCAIIYINCDIRRDWQMF